MKIFVLLLALGAMFIQSAIAAVATQLPQLNWPAERSDWVNVKTDVSPAAKGDGATDDTAAIQAAINLIPTGNDYSGPRTVYLPPGTYKVTSTLHAYNAVGIFFVGHGRDTRIVWAGAAGGRMLWCDSCPRSRFVGMIWDGAGIAGVGIDHDAKVRYETGMLHKHEEFRNFTTAGIRVGSNQTFATAEVHYQNCLFRNNSAGLRFQQYNDYDNTIQACNFLTNSTGVYCNPGNFNIYECHFEGSSSCDIYGPIHSCSVTRSTSIGSQMFYSSDASSGKNTTMVENCAIDSWANSSGTLVFCGGGPLTIVDCKFTNPPNNASPVRLAQPSSEVLRVITSGNAYPGTTSLVNPGPNGEVTEITGRAATGYITSATQSFFSDTDTNYVPPGTLFDARTGFGAAGNGSTDDTAAIQNCINAARNAGNGAIAYIPAGQYKITATLNVSGSNYRVGGEGWGTFLNWGGGSSGTMMQVSEAHNLTIEALRFASGSDMSNTRIKQIASTAPSSVFYDYIFAYTGPSYYGGIKFVGLPAGNTVRINSLYGDVNTADCNAATILTDVAVGAYNIKMSNPSHGAKTGLCGFNFVNTAGGGTGAGGFTVTDNQDLIVDSIYSESVSAPWLAASGDGNTTTTGRVTLGGGGKNHGYDQPIVSMSNFSGRVFLNANSCTPQHIDANGDYISGQFNCTGTATCDLTVAGMGFYRVPTFNTATGERLITYANSGQAVGQTGTPELTIPVNQPAGWQGPTAAAFDDLAQLGSNMMSAFYATTSFQTDTNPPAVTLTAPANGAVVSNVVAISATATDNVAVASVQFKLDGVNLGAPVVTAPYTISWNTAGITNGTHTVQAIAFDTSGNTASDAVSVLVSNETQPPTVTLTAPADGAVVSNVVAVAATASDNVAVASVQFQADGVPISPPVVTPPYSVSWNTSSLNNGAHTVSAIAFDTSGNSATNGISVLVSNTVVPPPATAPVQVAGELIVNLTQADLAANGGLVWTNRTGYVNAVGNFHTVSGINMPRSTAYPWNARSVTALAVANDQNNALISERYVPASMTGNGACSSEAWVYCPAYGVPNSDVLAYGVQGGSGAPKQDREMCADGSSTSKAWSFNFGGKDLTWVNQPSLNAWHHLAWTYDGANAAAYVDGVLDVSGNPATLATVGSVVVVGAGIAGGATDGSAVTYPFAGYIAAARLSTGALSASQVASNCAAGPFATVAIQLYGPTITPANTNIAQGAAVTLGVNAVTDGSVPMSYQWYTDNGSGGAAWSAVGGAVGTSYLPSTATLGTFQYRVQATNLTYHVGALSPPAALNVVYPRLNAAYGGGALTLTWSDGVLLQATAVTGPWTTNSTAASPYVIYPATNAPALFYRLRR